MAPFEDTGLIPLPAGEYDLSLAVLNTLDEPMTCKVKFLLSSAPVTIGFNINLRPGQTANYEQLFSLVPGAADDRSRALALIWQRSIPKRPLSFAWIRFPGSSQLAFTPVRPSSRSPMFLPGLEQSPARSTDLVLMGPPCDVELSLLTPSGTRIGESITVILPPGDVARYAQVASLWVGGEELGPFTLEVSTPGVELAACAVLSDTSSSDRMLITPDGSIYGSRVVPVLLSDGEQPASLLHTSLTLFNPWNEEMELSCRWLQPENQPVEYAVRTNLGPHVAVTFGDIISLLFPAVPQQSRLGALCVSSASEQTPAPQVVVRTSYQRDAGAVGFAVPVLGLGDAVTPGRTGYVLGGDAASELWAINLDIVEPCLAELSLLNAEGGLEATEQLLLDPAQSQIVDLVQGAATVVRVTVLQGGPVVAYGLIGSLDDGDPVLSPVQLDTPWQFPYRRPHRRRLPMTAAPMDPPR